MIEQDNQLIQNEINADCEKLKKITGQLDCVSYTERKDLQKQDPYKLAQYFKRLDKSSSNKKQQRILSSLISNKKSLAKLLDTKVLPPDIQESFSEELSYLRDEIIRQDCLSDRCSGQVNLGKIVRLIELLIGD